MTATVAKKFNRENGILDDMLDIAIEEEAENRHMDEMHIGGAGIIVDLYGINQHIWLVYSL